MLDRRYRSANENARNVLVISLDTNAFLLSVDRQLGYGMSLGFSEKKNNNMKCRISETY